MGTFAGFLGNPTIPEEKRDEFNRRMLYLLEQGGMLNIEQIQIYGKQIGLFAPLKPDEDNCVVFRYNWFEDDYWEPACYEIDTNELHTRKIGYSKFCAVICAAYVLYEFYTKEFGIAERDGMIFYGDSYIGWINYLFNESYTNARMEDPYKIYCLKPDTFREKSLLPFVFDGDVECVSHVGFTKYAEAFLQEQHSEEEWKEMLQKAEEKDKDRPPYPPVEKVTTTEFLVSKRLSDDDRAYYWKPNSDVKFSSEMTEWMDQLREEFLEIKADPERFIKGQDLTRMLVELLADADKNLGLIGMFEVTFYDLLSHLRDPCARPLWCCSSGS